MTPETSTQAQNSISRRVLVAGVGNVLQGDDGFGVRVVQELAKRTDLPPCVNVIDVGIGGMSLVQELFAGYSALVVVDAVDRGGKPGTIYLLEAEVPDLADMPAEERENHLADMHLATPSRAFVLAKGLGVLPPRVYILGCQSHSIEDLSIGLSEEVEGAVAPTIERLVREVHRLSGTDTGAREALIVE